MEWDEIMVFVVDAADAEVERFGPVQWAAEIAIDDEIDLTHDGRTDSLRVLAWHWRDGGRFVKVIAA